MSVLALPSLITKVGPSFEISHTYAAHPLLEQPLMQLDPQLLVQHHSEPRGLMVVAPPHPEQLSLLMLLGLSPLSSTRVMWCGGRTTTLKKSL